MQAPSAVGWTAKQRLMMFWQHKKGLVICFVSVIVIGIGIVILFTVAQVKTLYARFSGQRTQTTQVTNIYTIAAPANGTTTANGTTSASMTPPNSTVTTGQNSTTPANNTSQTGNSTVATNQTSTGNNTTSAGNNITSNQNSTSVSSNTTSTSNTNAISKNSTSDIKKHHHLHSLHEQHHHQKERHYILMSRQEMWNYKPYTQNKDQNQQNQDLRNDQPHHKSKSQTFSFRKFHQ